MIGAHSEARQRRARRGALLVALTAVMLLLSACTAADADEAAPLPAVDIDASDTVYVSIGDSYAAGFQPAPISSAAGFAQQIAQRSATFPQPLTLANFGCSGATSSAVREDVGCETAGSTDDAVSYPSTTQLAAAIDLLRAHEGRIGLVTISIGGNDVAPCMEREDAVRCAEELVPVIRENLDAILDEVRAVVGSDVPIVGTTYPDVYVKDIASEDAGARAVAEASIAVFRDVLNPALATAYERAGAGFADITADTGAYLPVDDLVVSATGGTVPTAVEAICRYTHYCEGDDIHPTTAGYSLMADRVIEIGAELTRRAGASDD